MLCFTSIIQVRDTLAVTSHVFNTRAKIKESSAYTQYPTVPQLNKCQNWLWHFGGGGGGGGGGFCIEYSDFYPPIIFEF